MPNAHSSDKICVSAWIPRTLARRLVKKAKQFKLTVSDFLNLIYTNATQDVELSAEDYREIARQTEAAQKRVDRRRERNRSSAKGDGGKAGQAGAK